MRTPSKDVLQGMKDKENAQEKALEEFKVMSESFDGRFWELMKARLVVRADGYAKVREEKFFDLNETTLKVLKAREEELRFIASVPADIIASYKELVKQNNELKREIREYERRFRETV